MGGEDVNADNVGFTAVMLASQGGHLDCIKYLVREGGADVNAADNVGRTAVMEASHRGHLEAVAYLTSQ